MSIVSNVQVDNIRLDPLPEKDKGLLAILRALSLVRDILAKEGQKEQGVLVDKLVETRLKVQDKFAREHKRLIALNTEVLKDMEKSEKFNTIASWIFYSALAIGLMGGGAPLLAKAFSNTFARVGASVIGFVSAILPQAMMVASGGFQIAAQSEKISIAPKLKEVAQLEEVNQIDAGLGELNQDMTQVTGSTLGKTADARAALQRVITEIMDSDRSAKLTAIGG